MGTVNTPEAVLVAIDGGGSKTDAVAIGLDGSVLAHVLGPASSPQALGVEPAVKVVDMASTICPDGNNLCAAVIGNVLVYLQGSHLTRTYVDSAEPQLSAKLFKATGGAFGSR